MNIPSNRARQARRWWLLPTTGGLVATATIAAIGVVPVVGALAVPVPDDGGGAVSGPAVLSSSAAMKAPVSAWTRPCFLVRARWNDAEGPRPLCPDPVFSERRVPSSVDRASVDPASCPSIPDVRAVGGPWFAEVRGCPQVTHWWRYVDAPR